MLAKHRLTLALVLAFAAYLYLGRKSGEKAGSKTQSPDTPASNATDTGFTIRFPLSDPTRFEALHFNRNPNARPVAFAQALAFLAGSSAHLGEYALDRNDCKHFARRLFQEAQAQGIESRFLSVTLENHEAAHALVALSTTDGGFLYADFTPEISKKDGHSSPSKNIAFVEAGKPYFRIPLERLPSTFLNQAADFEAFHQKQQDMTAKLAEFNERSAQADAESKRIQNEINVFEASARNAKLSPDEYTRKRESLKKSADSANAAVDDLRKIENSLKLGMPNLGTVGDDWIVKSVLSYPQ